jgi:hypothetical protein
MLKRNCLQEKKKKKKSEIDRKRELISKVLERDLKDANSKKVASELREDQQALNANQYIMLSLD